MKSNDWSSLANLTDEEVEFTLRSFRKDRPEDLDWIVDMIRTDRMNALAEELETDGLPPDWKYPEWDNPSKCHDWKNHIHIGVLSLWSTFNDLQKQAIARQAQELADNEDWE